MFIVLIAFYFVLYTCTKNYDGIIIFQPPPPSCNVEIIMSEKVDNNGRPRNQLYTEKTSV